MAIHFTALRALPAPLHRTPQAAARTLRPAEQQVRRPETPPAFRLLAPASAASVSAAPQAPLDAAAAFKKLFSGVSTNTVPATTPAAAPAVPTAESVFGPNPWLANPTGLSPDGSFYGYNQQYFATPQTAAAVAAMVGGTVVQVNAITSAPGTHFQQQQPNQMVQLKNGGLINPGLVAGFYTHGYSQSMVDQMIANEVANTTA